MESHGLSLMTKDILRLFGHLDIPFVKMSIKIFLIFKLGYLPF